MLGNVRLIYELWGESEQVQSQRSLPTIQSALLDGGTVWVSTATSNKSSLLPRIRHLLWSGIVPERARSLFNDFSKQICGVAGE